MKNILVADDHMVIRTGLKSLLQDQYTHLRIFEAGTGGETLQLLKQQPVDLLVLDLQMPDMDPMSVIELIAIKYPRTYILVFSMLPEKIYARRAIKAGAAGYLPKDSSFPELKEAFDAALNNKRYMSPTLLELVSNEIQANHITSPFEALSHREFEIVSMLLSGNTLTAIARHLNIKPSTVGTYKARIFQKLGTNSLFELHEMAVLHEFRKAHA